jgi:hypothetical protein
MGYLETIFEAAERLGGDVDKQLKPARDFRARADELNRQLDQARSAEESAYGELVEAIATGRVPPGEAAKASGTWIFDSQASKTIVTAVSVCHTKAAAAAREAGGRVFGALQGRTARIVAESVRQSVALPRGIDSEAKALRHRNGTRSALDTWERLRELVDEWTACHELARTMQLATWVPGPSHPRDTEGARLFERYEKPLSLPPGYWNRTPAELRLGVAQAAGAMPGLYPWPDVVVRFRRWDRRQHDYRPMEILRAHDSMGNIVAEQHGPTTAGKFVPLGGGRGR